MSGRGSIDRSPVKACAALRVLLDAPDDSVKEVVERLLERKAELGDQTYAEFAPSKIDAALKAAGEAE